MGIVKFDEQALRNFASVLASILTHGKITEMLALCNIPQAEGSNKSDRIYYALKRIQDRNDCGNNVMDLIQKTITPKRYDDYQEFENHRAKAYYQQYIGDQQHRPGYYWLAHKWENLMYACEVCNRSYKQNYFPLKDPSKRFDPAVRDISEEEPLLINPYEERNPERHLTFEGTTIKPLTDEGKASIEFYGLDREELNESRQDIYAPIKALEEAVQLAQGTPREAPTVDVLKKLIQDDIARGRYTLMIRSNFGEYL